MSQKSLSDKINIFLFAIMFALLGQDWAMNALEKVFSIRLGIVKMFLERCPA